MTTGIKIDGATNVTIKDNKIDGFETAIDANNIEALDISGNIIITPEKKSKINEILDQILQETDDEEVVSTVSGLRRELEKKEQETSRVKDFLGFLGRHGTTIATLAIQITKLIINN